MSGDIQDVTLPDRKEMERQLLRMNSHPFMVSNLYPRLLEAAGENTTVQGVAVLITLAVVDCIRGHEPAMKLVVINHVKNIVPILVSDEAAQHAILKTLREARLA